MTTITDKLKVSQYVQKAILNKPADIHDFDTIDFDTKISNVKYDFIFAFIFKLKEFPALIQQVIDKDLLNSDGYLYFAYPKKGNKQYKEYIGRDDFFPSVNMDDDGYVNGSLIKFNKMIAFNEVFTCIGLKYVARKQSKSKQPSQLVRDYVDCVQDVQKYLTDKPETLRLFNELTPGYQRNWARFVYSTKSEETTQKRLAEMESILNEGYKSIDLYRKKKK